MLKEIETFLKKNSVIQIMIGIVCTFIFIFFTFSFVNNILMPLIGLCLGGIDFTGLSINIGNANINYGIFFTDIIKIFLIILGLHVLIKYVNIKS